jgi:hypothetical protein
VAARLHSDDWPSGLNDQWRAREARPASPEGTKQFELGIFVKPIFSATTSMRRRAPLVSDAKGGQQ